MKNRCEWSLYSKIMQQYHDLEWGVPLHDDQSLFEVLCLQGAQAGLSWHTILERRENYRKAFDRFDFEKIKNYNDIKIEELLKNKRIIRNKLKINSVVTNAKAFIKIRNEFGSFNNYIWKFTNQLPIQNKWHSLKAMPGETELSMRISKDMKKRGFKFIGSKIMYAFMQAVGMVNDHIVSCFRYQECKNKI